MPSSTRITGTKLFLRIGTTDFAADISNYLLDNEEADQGVVTFADAAEGGKRQWKLSGTAVQSTDTASFWTWVWANTGTTVPFTLSPHGRSSGTAAEPVFTGNVKIGARPAIGGEAAISNGDFTFDFEWDVQGTPVKTP
ncbi:hypothetical protein [Microbacterium paludicola]|uniref:hypothetical protein n=1 Tax=Microbacterium paludicola TaxID=300019 RepID=UPI000A597948|nr:hypothetical protein [Microbacterium paludicola]